MKKRILPLLLLSTMLACGNEGNNNDDWDRRGPPHRDRGPNCHTSTSSADWRDFVENVKNLNFAEHTSIVGCTEYRRSIKLQNCDQKGIFYICDGSTYDRLLGSNTCSSGPLHGKSLVDLVTPMPLNFEAEICGNTMVGAMIGVKGKGKHPDLYEFDFEMPVHYNPRSKQIWKDTDRRYEIITRQ